jgi:hypothetical protein
MCCNCPADAPWIGRATEVPTKPIKRHQELSDVEIDQTTIDDLRAAYRTLRDHHVAETTALISKHKGLAQKYEDLSRRCEEMLAKSSNTLAVSRQLVERTATIVREDEKALDDAAKILASRAADPADLGTTDHLSDDELATWAEQTGAQDGTYLRMVLDELRERRDAEVLFAEIDREFQSVDCETCDDEGADHCAEHAPIVKRWRSTRAALCDLARIHRGYLRSLNAPDSGDPQ